MQPQRRRHRRAGRPKAHLDRTTLPATASARSAHADAGVEREAREAGASGFLAKGTGLQDLVITLHEAAGDEPVL